MKAEIIIPKGYRRLGRWEFLQAGDRVLWGNEGEFGLLLKEDEIIGDLVGRKVSIRRIKRAKPAKSKGGVA